MDIRFWGAQGSYPSPISNADLYGKIKSVLKRVVVSDLVSDDSITSFIASLPHHMTHTYGGNTSCISAIVDNTVIIFDAGTGIIPLGRYLAEHYLLKKTDTIHLFVTHTHWDHVQGFPFFAPPLWMKDVTINIYSPMKSLQKRFEGQHYPQYLPFTLKDVPANVVFHEIEQGGSVSVEGHTVGNIRQYHPNGSYAYRLDAGNTSFGYTGDTEFNVNSLSYFNKAVSFFKEVDVLVCDTQYLIAESFQKIDWGHSTTSIMLDLALKARVANMVLNHHEPLYSDEKLFEILQKTEKYLRMINDTSLRVHIAHEGLTLSI